MASSSLVSKAMRLPIVVVLGATGAGKSKLALELAVKFNGEIISADSMQVYHKLDIVTNKVTHDERRLCTHHIIDCISPLVSNFTVVNFRNTALPIIDSILSKKKLPIIVGGTNYYIESLLWNMLIDSEEKPQEHDVVPSSECVEKHKPPGECDKDRDASPLPPACSSEKHNIDDDRLHHKNYENPPKRLKSGETKALTLHNETTEMLYERLLDVDVDRAKQLHPNDRRKIIRSLEVFYDHGQKMSDMLREQHEHSGGISGPLRYPDPCILWVTCSQDVLDVRTDKRVDKMIQQGLLEELTEFHREYNQLRLDQNKKGKPDYTLGIFQSIGFKEFHDYLVLSAEERETVKGKAELAKGIEDMKRATRQYARKQNKWIVNRFLKRRGGEVPPVYSVDSTDPSKWQDTVHEPACRVLSSFIQGSQPPFEPLPVRKNDNEPIHRRCDVCNLLLLTSQQWEAHVKSRRHKKNAHHQRKTLKITEETVADHSQNKDNDNKYDLHS